MKRQPELLPDGKQTYRRVRARHEDSHARTGNLDLNAVPQGFDLNAPIIEELECLGQPPWMPKDKKEEENAIEETEKDCTHYSNLQGPEFQADMTTEEVGSEGKDKKALLQGLELGVGEASGTREENEMAFSEQPKSSVIAAIPRRPLESAMALGISEDLDILSSIWCAYEHDDMNTLDGILTEACEELTKNPLHPSKYHYLTCIYVSKKLPEVFSLQTTFKILLTFFSPNNSQIGAKRQMVLPLLASKLLLRAFESVQDWPLEFVRIYLEDAVGRRGWIDHDGCKEFVTNILTAFSDAPKEATTPAEDLTQSRSQGSPGRTKGPTARRDAAIVSHSDLSGLKNRYPSIEVRRVVQKEFLEAVHQLLGTPSIKENPRQLLRLLMQGAEYEEVRVLGSSMLESWLNNPVHLRAAKALLDRILEHMHGISEKDISTVTNLLALRVPSSQTAGQIKSLHGNIYAEMITHLVHRRSEYARLALKTFVMAEINCKNLSNLKSIATVLKVMPVSPPPEQELALVLQEQAVYDESKCQLREFVRRLMKHMGQDLNIHALCRGLLQPWQAMAEQAESLKDIWITQLVDLTCQLLVLGIAPIASDESFVQAINVLAKSTSTVSEASSTFSASQEKFLLLEKFSLDMAAFQTEAMEWCTEVLVNYLPGLTTDRFKSIVRKFLFLEDPQVLFTKSESFRELDLSSFQLLSSCTRASEEILARLILMGISTGFPLTQAEALQIIESLVWRAAALGRHLVGALEAESTQLPVAILKLASLNLPGVPRQPSLQLVFKDLYWRACIVVLLVAVNNASKLGRYVWENIPTVRTMMEALITCSRGFFPICCSEVERKEAERQEVEALERDAKAEEAIGAFMLEKSRSESAAASMHIDGLPSSSTSSPQNNEWKGNVMFLNHTNMSRKPPPSVIKEIDRAEESFQLGQTLRKCNDPDFFVETTTSQMLPHAWLWLRKALAQESELVTRLPLSWQVELLYIYEGLHPTNQSYLTDLYRLYASLNMAVTQSCVSHENEIDAIMNFLSKKLASTQCAVRSQARRCFAGIFNPSFFSAVYKETVSSMSEQGGLLGFASVKKEDMRWLEMLDVIPAGPRLLQSVCPAIQNAIQQETSLDVIAAYLTFLRKNAPPPPSSGSLACCVALLTTRRRMLTAALLQRSQKCSASATGFFHKFTQMYQSVADLFLDTLKEALEVGILCDDSQTELQNVVLVYPYYQQDINEISFSRVKIQKIVVDSAIQVLTVLSSEENQLLKEYSSYEEIVKLLFPGFVIHDEHVGQVPMAWLEVNSGGQLPLLSGDQARALSRSKDARLVQAGLFVIGNEEKLELCAGLGLSSAARAALINELASVVDSRLKTQSKERIWWSASKDNKKVEQSFSLVALTSNRKVCEDPVCDVQTSMAGRNALQTAVFVSDENTRREDCTHKKIKVKDIGQLLYQLFPKRNSLPMYIQARKLLQVVNFCGGAKTLLMESDPECKSPQSIESKSLQEFVLLRLYLPMLASLGGFKTALLQLSNVTPECTSVLTFKHGVELILRGIKALSKGSIGGESLFIDDKMSNAFTQANHLVNMLDNFLLKPLHRSYSEHGDTHTIALESGSNETAAQTNRHSTAFSGLQFQNIESNLHKHLWSRLHSAWKGKDANNENKFQDLTKEVCDFFNKWHLDGELSHLSEYFHSKTAGYNRSIATAGLYGLFIELSTFLDADLVLEDHLIHVLEVSHMSAWDLSTQMPRILLFPPVMLGWIVHHTSWAYMTKVFKRLLEATEGLLAGRNNLLFPSKGDLKEFHAKGISVNAILLKQMLTFGAVMEFMNSLLNGPRTCLIQSVHDLEKVSGSKINLTASLLTPASLRVICSLGLIVSAICSILNRSCVENQCFEPSTVTTLQADAVTIKNYCLQYDKVAVKVLISVASHDSYFMRTVVHELWDWEQRLNTNIFNNVFLGDLDFKSVLKSTAKKLLWRLYMSWPLSVEAVLQFGSCRELMTSNLSMNMDIFFGKSFLLGQASLVRAIIHRAMVLIFRESTKEIDAMYRFCQSFARQHPAFFLYSLQILAVLLQELLPFLKTEDIELRNRLARALSMGIGLLDALRPHIFSFNFSNQSKKDHAEQSLGRNDQIGHSDVGQKTVSLGGLEAVLSVYMHFLQSIEDQDAPQFGRVVARLADFLCHCVASGGHCCSSVAAYRDQVLDKAAEKFSKIKKLSYLLGLIDISTSGENQKIDDSKILPASLPLEQVQTVHQQLSRFVYLHKVAMPVEHEANTRLSRKQNQRHPYPRMDESVEDVELLVILEDLDQASTRMPSVLSMLEDVLLELIQIADTNINDLVYDLLERLLLECPSERSSRKVIEVLLKQLTSSDASQVRMAAKQASRFFFFCADMQEVILLELFQVSQCAPDHLQQLLQVLLTLRG